jgi:hypothetical protein
MKSYVLLIVWGLCSLPCLTAEETPKPLPIVAVKAARLIDPAAGAVRENQVVIIEGDKVKSIGTAADQTKLLPPDARVIDLGNATVLPGLIDSTPMSQLSRRITMTTFFGARQSTLRSVRTSMRGVPWKRASPRFAMSVRRNTSISRSGMRSTPAQSSARAFLPWV